MARRYIEADEFRERPLGTSLRQYTDELLNEYAEIATAAVEGLCERRFDEAEHTETLRGSGSARLILYNYPVSEIDSITATSISDGSTEEVDLSGLVRTDLNDAAGILERADDIWSPALLYEITYTAGFEVVPAPVRHATAVWMTELLKPDFAGPTMDLPEIVPFSTQQIVELLTPYKRRRIV